MRAMILAGGRGSRMGKLTGTRPKPLLEVSGKPILEHLIKNASEAGIKDYLVSVGYLGHMIQGYFGNGSTLRVNIQYLETQVGAEQTMYDARERLGESFCCFCGDNILLPSQIERIIRLHSKRNADATFTLEQSNSETMKRVRVRRDRIIGSGASVRDPVLVYNMVMQTDFLEVLYETVKEEKDKAFAFAMDGLAKRHSIYTANIGYFVNINHPEDIAKAEMLLREGDKK